MSRSDGRRGRGPRGRRRGRGRPQAGPASCRRGVQQVGRAEGRPGTLHSPTGLLELADLALWTALARLTGGLKAAVSIAAAAAEDGLADIWLTTQRPAAGVGSVDDAAVVDARWRAVAEESVVGAVLSKHTLVAAVASLVAAELARGGGAGSTAAVAVAGFGAVAEEAIVALGVDRAFVAAQRCVAAKRARQRGAGLTPAVGVAGLGTVADVAVVALTVGGAFIAAEGGVAAERTGQGRACLTRAGAAGLDAVADVAVVALAVGVAFVAAARRLAAEAARQRRPGLTGPIGAGLGAVAGVAVGAVAVGLHCRQPVVGLQPLTHDSGVPA